MNSVVGIDLGTTYSAVAQFDEFGRPVMVADQDGKYLLPSCVALIHNEWRVGTDAWGQWAADHGMDQKSSAARFKREMGTSKHYPIAEHSLTPVELSSHMLKCMAAYAKKALGPIAPVVITVPANFSNEARQATIDAAEDAGINLANIINEPTAAALYYAYSGKLDQTGTYAIFDLGGGTFDITIAKFDGKSVDVIWSDGIARLGGVDFDEALQMALKEKYEQLTGEEISAQNISHEGFDLRRVQDLKHSLSRRDKVTFFVRGQVIEILREEFESKISNFVTQIQLCCENALDGADLDASALDGVILAGGSTRIPAIQQCVREVFGKEPLSIANVDEVVALGAALYAGHRSDQDVLTKLQQASAAELSVQDVANKHFGTKALSWDEDLERPFEINSIIIPKGTPIPCSETESYLTVMPDQTSVDCSITECDHEEIDYDSRFIRVLGEGTLKLPPGRPAGQEIIVTYEYDINQIMHCHFEDVESGEKKEITIDLMKGV
ncbi:MAG: Hsp70 family protein [Rhodothermaceae bacterium]|nr:Hsp70 family protein [Bacteroidota bacterium]MXW32228.1 Hsp70 family protein [Rhodothermaceae bacterium]MXZ17138.1 Hsp70 family protein [Rhodothermaceae bacterium]MYE64080.1 Hsp70 family protein [Rhodothermaceae bacterium]MYG70077.1 Hsp70 family protein [Rhodothermaceae bacterium]